MDSKTLRTASGLQGGWHQTPVNDVLNDLPRVVSAVSFPNETSETGGLCRFNDGLDGRFHNYQAPAQLNERAVADFFRMFLLAYRQEVLPALTERRVLTNHSVSPGVYSLRFRSSARLAWCLIPIASGTSPFCLSSSTVHMSLALHLHSLSGSAVRKVKQELGKQKRTLLAVGNSSFPAALRFSDTKGDFIKPTLYPSRFDCPVAGYSCQAQQRKG